MPAEKKEIIDAKKEGIEFLFQNNVVEIKGNEKVEKIELIKTKLLKKENEERAIPVNIEKSNFEINTDYIIMAIGGVVSDEVYSLNLEINEWGNIIVNENLQTSNPKIFAGGDVTGNKQTVAWAAKSGRDAAKKIINMLQNLDFRN